MFVLGDSETYLASLTAQLQSRASYDPILENVVSHFGCSAGTIHLLNFESRLLELKSHVGIPAMVIGRIDSIPVGKGMAGLAAKRVIPVQVCNLQKDDSGVAQIGARDTRMEGSIAVPMIAGETVRGVLGIAKPVAYEFSQAECDLLLKIGAIIADNLAE